MKNSKVLAKQLEVQLEKVSLLKVLLPLNFQLSIQKKWIIVDRKTNSFITVLIQNNFDLTFAFNCTKGE